MELHNMKYTGGIDDVLALRTLHPSPTAGTTAVCVSVLDGEVVCANVGDSRSVAGFVTAQDAVIAVPLSRDQTPMREVPSPCRHHR